MNKLIIIVLTLLVSCASLKKEIVEVEWPKFTIGETAFLIPATVDELQTMKITSLCRENNPIIGRCGQNVSVGMYFFTAEVLHIGVALLLPPKWRRWWQGLTAGGEISIAWNNHADGILILPWH